MSDLSVRWMEARRALERAGLEIEEDADVVPAVAAAEPDLDDDVEQDTTADEAAEAKEMN